jgi:RNA polymerase sigma-70 factor (ECF subfamily)
MVLFDELKHADTGHERHEPRTGVLVVQAQRGDPAALERLMERCIVSLTGFCRRLAGAQGGAQDLVQETLLRAVVSLGRLEEPERFEAWLFGIAANVARKRWQRDLRAPLSLDEAMAHPDTESIAVRPLWEAPERAVELAERAREIERAVRALPEHLSRVVALRYADGLSYAEIAAELAVPVSTVKWRLFHSRRRLRAALGTEELQAPERRPRTAGRTAKGTAMQIQTGSQEADRVIGAAENRIARAAAFYGHWFGRPVGVDGLTEDAKGVIRRATAEGQRFVHNYVGT